MFQKIEARGKGRWARVRRGSRLKNKRRPGSRRAFRVLRQHKVPAAAALLLALFIVCSFLPRRCIPKQTRPPGTPPAEEQIGDNGSSSSMYFYGLLLGCEIPGLKGPAVNCRARLNALLRSALYACTGVDPANPCSVLSLELGAGGEIARQALAPWKDPGSSPSPGLETGKTASSTREEILFPFPLSGDNEAGIFLYHTHASESFIPGGAAFGENPTVVTAGAELARMLEETYGLTVLHHRSVYDLPRRDAYKKARPAVEKIIAGNPNIELVIDLHRDGIARSKSTAVIDGRELARILLVHGRRNPHSEKNLEFVLCLQRELEAVKPSLSRGIMYQDFIYNQDLHPYAILIELGSHENSADEAALSLPYLAEAIARAYYIFFLQD